MKINESKASSYNDVSSECIYDYIRQYADAIRQEVEPAEDRTGNAYKAIREQFSKADRTQLKAIAAELETVTKRLAYMLYGKY
jgi:phosphoenolpyruvate-protein kinase (PTS system EI component)